MRLRDVSVADAKAVWATVRNDQKVLPGSILGLRLQTEVVCSTSASVSSSSAVSDPLPGDLFILRYRSREMKCTTCPKHASMGLVGDTHQAVS